MLPDEPTDEEREQELPEDNGTPFRPAGPNPDPTGPTDDPVDSASNDAQLDDTHPATDTNVQPEELYDEGVSGAAEAQEPDAGNAVSDYTPPAAQPGQTVSPTTDSGTASGTDDSTPVESEQQEQDVSPGEQPPA